MPTLPAGFHEAGLDCFPVGLPQDGRFACLPPAPLMRAASLLTTPVGARLTLDIAWHVDAARLEVARTAIAARHPELAGVRLDVAKMAGVVATLSMEDDGQPRRAVGVRSDPAAPAHTVRFDVILTAAEKDTVLHIVRSGDGNVAKGRLMLCWEGTLKRDEAIQMEVEGDLGQAIRALAPPPPRKPSGLFWHRQAQTVYPPPPHAACDAAIGLAIERGEVALVQASTPDTTEATRAAALGQIRMLLANVLHEHLHRLGPDAAAVRAFPIRFKQVFEGTASYPVSGSVDVGVWCALAGESMIDAGNDVIPEPAR